MIWTCKHQIVGASVLHIPLSFIFNNNDFAVVPSLPLALSFVCIFTQQGLTIQFLRFQDQGGFVLQAATQSSYYKSPQSPWFSQI